MTEGTFRDWPLPASPPTEPPPAPPGMARGPGVSPREHSPRRLLLLWATSRGTRRFAGKRTGRWSAVSPSSLWWPAASAPPSAWGWPATTRIDSPAVTQRHGPVRRGGDDADPDRHLDRAPVRPGPRPPPMSGAALDVKGILAKVEPSVVDIVRLEPPGQR